MNRELLSRVCHTPGIPGYEDDIEATVWLLKVFLEHARIAAAGHGSKRTPRLRIGCSTA